MPRGGIEVKIHGLGAVSEQMLQVAADYAGLPDIRTLTIPEIRFFYEPLIDQLASDQRERMKKGSSGK